MTSIRLLRTRVIEMASSTARTMHVVESATIRKGRVTTRTQPVVTVLPTVTRMLTNKLIGKASAAVTMRASGSMVAVTVADPTITIRTTVMIILITAMIPIIGMTGMVVTVAMGMISTG